MVAKFKNLVNIIKQNKRDIILFIIVFLISLLSFIAGYLI